MPEADDYGIFQKLPQGTSSSIRYLLILRLLMKRYTDVNQIMINHIPNHIRNIKTVDMAIRLSVIMMTSLVNQLRYTEEKMLFISS